MSLPQTNLSDILNGFSPSDRLFNATYVCFSIYSISKYKHFLKMKKLACLFSDNLAFLHILQYLIMLKNKNIAFFFLFCGIFFPNPNFQL